MYPRLEIKGNYELIDVELQKKTKLGMVRKSNEHLFVRIYVTTPFSIGNMVLIKQVTRKT